jgi:hypothetical protein
MDVLLGLLLLLYCTVCLNHMALNFDRLIRPNFALVKKAKQSKLPFQSGHCVTLGLRF